MQKLRITAVNVCRFVLAATFIFSGYVKAIDPLGTLYKLKDYAAAMSLNGLLPDWALALMGRTPLQRLRDRTAAIIVRCGVELKAPHSEAGLAVLDECLTRARHHSPALEIFVDPATELCRAVVGVDTHLDIADQLTTGTDVAGNRGTSNEHLQPLFNVRPQHFRGLLGQRPLLPLPQSREILVDEGKQLVDRFGCAQPERKTVAEVVGEKHARALDLLDDA